MPWYVEWTLAFPRAPSGSVSINVWSAACATVCQVVGDVILHLMVQLQGRKEGGKGGIRRKEEPFGAGTQRGEKKEL